MKYIILLFTIFSTLLCAEPIENITLFTDTKSPIIVHKTSGEVDRINSLEVSYNEDQFRQLDVIVKIGDENREFISVAPGSHLINEVFSTPQRVEIEIRGTIFNDVEAALVKTFVSTHFATLTAEPIENIQLYTDTKGPITVHKTSGKVKKIDTLEVSYNTRQFMKMDIFVKIGDEIREFINIAPGSHVIGENFSTPQYVEIEIRGTIFNDVEAALVKTRLDADFFILATEPIENIELHTDTKSPITVHKTSGKVTKIDSLEVSYNRRQFMKMDIFVKIGNETREFINIAPGSHVIGEIFSTPQHAEIEIRGIIFSDVEAALIKTRLDAR